MHINTLALSRFSLGIGLAIALMAQAGCSRSQKARDSLDPAREDEDSAGYYNKSPSPTQKLDGMIQPKKRVTVLGFWNDTPVKAVDLGPFAADELKRNLFMTQKVIVPTDAVTELATEDFVKGEEIKVAQLIREGKKLGVSVLVVGRITRIVFRQQGEEVGVFRQKQSIAAVDTEIKVFDVLGGREILASSKSGDSTSNSVVAVEEDSLGGKDFRTELTKLAIRDAVMKLVPDVTRAVEKMAWQGHIARVIGNKIYINAGRQSGLVAGDILKVLTQGEDIHDPVTSAYLGRTQGQLKGTIEITDFIGADGAVAELHTGANLQEGDLVRLY